MSLYYACRIRCLFCDGSILVCNLCINALRFIRDLHVFLTSLGFWLLSLRFWLFNVCGFGCYLVRMLQ
ncbi:hypothetical protein RchiOBHm_Chr2g0144401 [Rosa chinensis]|uniref:Uncharacterized protein n=1 Tax=Rosa chinensis TaxID=74649 RepID=A0A2P6RYD9_ROSCH|nr:hypothetical protein RchiOBHm_Chr2g0144401 [Rosa chinensis]